MSAKMQQVTDATPELDQLCINTIRALTIDAVQKAKSGHPGLPLGAAPMAYALWTKFLRYNPKNPKWENRDRFLLSAGHGCMLLYSLLYLTGYDISLDEIKNFRQWGSKTPGHPEYGLAPGVEITTGPLGQGFTNGVGMAMGAAHLAAKFNQKDFSLIDHYVYAIVSDGDLMEGVASEAASLAGHLKLGKLIYLYDDNHVTIEGFTSLAFSEVVPKRFEAYGWHTSTVEDGNDLAAIEAAIRDAQSVADQPSLISVKTTIGYGMPTAGTRKAHSDPPGEEAVRDYKKGQPKMGTILVQGTMSTFNTVKLLPKLDEMGLNVKLVNTTFEAIIPGLAAGRYDIGASSFTDTKEREKTVDFVTYLSVGQAFLSKSTGGPKLNTLAELCGHTVSVEKGTTELEDAEKQNKKCKEAGKPIKLLIFPGQNDANLALSSGRAEVDFADSPIIAYQVRKLGVNVRSSQTFGTSPEGLALPKGNGMAKPVLEALKVLMANGTYQAILRKWELQSAAISNPTINGATR